MTERADELMERLREQLRQQPELAAQLPSTEGEIVREALAGFNVYDIAQSQRMSEEAVWRVLRSAAQMSSGQPPVQKVETGGMGSDTDPGVTGGYGETAFGSLGNEPPTPLPEEPPAED
ncbi:MAG: hypothetical protein KatS3mg057_0457 [Herpetosiphonaceae bacterium]|nr:MAG: hypothetical protein KatS3mg057_0457 [Herpetosiphonaceae bacterium]